MNQGRETEKKKSSILEVLLHASQQSVTKWIGDNLKEILTAWGNKHELVSQSLGKKRHKIEICWWKHMLYSRQMASLEKRLTRDVKKTDIFVQIHEPVDGCMLMSINKGTEIERILLWYRSVCLKFVQSSKLFRGPLRCNFLSPNYIINSGVGS